MTDHHHPDHPDRGDSISMHDFLEFLKITCQVNDSFNSSKKNPPPFDYNQLARNELVNATVRPSENASPARQQGKKDDAQKKSFKKKSLSHGKAPPAAKPVATKQPESAVDVPKRNLDALLNEKLDEVLNEGILDSVLPFICPVNPPSSSSGYGKSIGTKPVVPIGMTKSIGSGGEASSPDVGGQSAGSSAKKTSLSAVGDVSQNFLIASSTSKIGARRKSSFSQLAIPDSRAE